MLMMLVVVIMMMYERFLVSNKSYLLSMSPFIHEVCDKIEILRGLE